MFMDMISTCDQYKAGSDFQSGNFDVKDAPRPGRLITGKFD